MLHNASAMAGYLTDFFENNPESGLAEFAASFAFQGYDIETEQLLLHVARHAASIQRENEILRARLDASTRAPLCIEVLDQDRDLAIVSRWALETARGIALRNRKDFGLDG